MEHFVSFIEFALLLTLYFVPSIIAAARRHHQGGAILTVNLFLGWTLLGWVVALVWSVSAVDQKSTNAKATFDIDAPEPNASEDAPLVLRNPEPAKSQPQHSDEKICPDCAETVKAAAKVCRFCGYRFDNLKTD